MMVIKGHFIWSWHTRSRRLISIRTQKDIVLQNATSSTITTCAREVPRKLDGPLCPPWIGRIA